MLPNSQQVFIAFINPIILKIGMTDHDLATVLNEFN